jgi:hypothetical protein
MKAASFLNDCIKIEKNDEMATVQHLIFGLVWKIRLYLFTTNSFIFSMI